MFTILHISQLSTSTPSVTQARFIEIKQDLHSTKENPLLQSLFIFEYSRDAELHNSIILEQFNFDIDKAIQAQPNSQIHYGLEFKPSLKLKELLEHHPHWHQLKSILDNGAIFLLSPITLGDRTTDNAFLKKRGNHRSAIKNCETLVRMINDNISRGFALPLPIDILPLLPNASLAPLGCVEQEMINELGEKNQILYDS